MTLSASKEIKQILFCLMTIGRHGKLHPTENVILLQTVHIHASKVQHLEHYMNHPVPKYISDLANHTVGRSCFK